MSSYIPYFGKNILNSAKNHGNINSLKLHLNIIKGETHTETLNKQKEINYEDHDNNTALIHACINNNRDIVQLLLENGVNINHQNKFGNTALIYACINNNRDIVQLLLENDVNINHQNKLGLTPLINACINNNYDIVKLLLEYDAQIDKVTNMGYTALTISIENEQHLGIIILLLQKNHDFHDIRSAIELDKHKQVPTMFAPHLIEKATKMDKYDYKNTIYTKIYSIIDNFIKTGNAHIINAHGCTMYGTFIIPNNICVCVINKTGQSINDSTWIKPALIKRVYFPGYSMNNMMINFKDDIVTSAIYDFNNNTLKKKKLLRIRPTSRYINNKSKFPNIVTEDKLKWTLNELLHEISISLIKDKNKEVACCFLHTCRVGKTNGYSSNNSNATNKHDIGILPSVYFIPENNKQKYKDPINNFQSKMANLYSTLN
jgi:ankyrin repeat protein